jgi:hypothetical protein
MRIPYVTRHFSSISWTATFVGLLGEALLRQHECNEVVDFFFIQQNTVNSPHVFEAFNDVSVWIKDRLLEVFKGGKLRDTVTGPLGDTLQRWPVTFTPI